MKISPLFSRKVICNEPKIKFAHKTLNAYFIATIKRPTKLSPIYHIILEIEMTFIKTVNISEDSIILICRIYGYLFDFNFAMVKLVLAMKMEINSEKLLFNLLYTFMSHKLLIKF